MGQTKLRDEQMGFNTSTGHDHDGTDSKKIAYTNVTDTPQFENAAQNILRQGLRELGMAI